MMTKVLVTDAQMRSSLAVIRSLGRAGLEVTAAEETRFATGMFSKYCADRLVYPKAKDDAVFASFMLDRAREGDYKAIFPVTDMTVIPIVKRKKEFERYTIVPYPDYCTLSRAVDKAVTLRIAMENDVPCPATCFVESEGDLDRAIGEMQFPVVIKPRIGYGSRGVTLCRTGDDLRRRYSETCARYGQCIIQEYIPNGGEMGVYALFNFDSEPRAVSVQRRLRSYPVSGGPSTFRETIKDPGLVDTAFRLLKALRWSGVAMVEFRRDTRDGVPKLMEVNPRFWGSLHLSILSGIDFPLLLYKLFTEGDVKPAMEYKAGVRCRWMLPGDILWYMSSPDKIRNLPKFLEVTNDDIMSFKDPGPTIGFTLAAARYMLDADMWKFMLRKSIEER